MPTALERDCDTREGPRSRISMERCWSRPTISIARLTGCDGFMSTTGPDPLRDRAKARITPIPLLSMNVSALRSIWIGSFPSMSASASASSDEEKRSSSPAKRRPTRGWIGEISRTVVDNFATPFASISLRSKHDQQSTIIMSCMSSPESNRWHFLTNHSQVLLCIEHNPDSRLRDIAEMVGVTERAAQRIVRDLVDAGYVSRERVGRRNRYAVNSHAPMRHPAQSEFEVGALLRLLRPERE
jgi:MarR family protein